MMVIPSEDTSRPTIIFMVSRQPDICSYTWQNKDDVTRTGVPRR